MSKFLVSLISTLTFLCLCIFSCSVVPVNTAQSTVVDHSNFDTSFSTTLSNQIKAMDVYFEHASVGSNIQGGMQALAANPPYDATLQSWDSTEMTTITSWYTNNNGLGDHARGNPGFANKVSDFNKRMRATGFAAQLDVASFKFCYIDKNDVGTAAVAFNSVLTVMQELEADFPNVTFIWWTMPLTCNGSATTDAYNALVRSYCQANQKYLLDIADIESHCPLAYAQLTPENYQFLYDGYTDETGDYGHLNNFGSERLARAYWTILGLIANN